MRDFHAKVEGKHACRQAALAAAAMETVNQGALAEGGRETQYLGPPDLSRVRFAAHAGDSPVAIQKYY